MGSVVVLCDVGLQCYQDGCSRPSNSHASHSASDDSSPQQEGLPNEIDAEQRLRNAVLAGDDEKLPMLSYVKQELRDTLLRVLNANRERQDGKGRELKALYCSLLAAWHDETREVEALRALRDHVIGILDVAAT